MSKLPFYIGTYNKSEPDTPRSEGIYRALLDTQNGQIGELELVAKAKNASFVALGRGGRQLYAVCDHEGSAVGAWAIEAGGKLRALNYQPSGGAGGCHLGVDAGGRNVLVANYGGGSVAAFPILGDGSLGERSSHVQHVGSGPHPKRQEKPHAHAIYGDETGRFVYACDLGTDEVFIYRFDAARGRFSPAVPPSIRLAPGAGPRHLALHPRGFAYVNNELSLDIAALARDRETGALTPLQTISTLPPGTVTTGFSTAEIHIHPGGDWLYVSNRGHDSITVFCIGGDGKLTLVQHVQVSAEPRGFGVSPDGNWLVAGGQKAHQIAAFAIDAKTGKLTPRGDNLELGAPVCVVFAA